MTFRSYLALLNLMLLFPTLGMTQYGQVIDTVRCKGNPEISYALYVPSYYDDREEWPVIFAFDPVARGSVPVELFQRAAEDFGYIIAGSNNSRNGPWEPIMMAAEAMIQDVIDSYPIDTNRIYTTGFSGGSRVASTIAMITEKMAGVIGCGAGFSPGYPPNFNIRFDYIGIIGTRDFNYQEMWQLDRWLQTFHVYHETLEFEGGHDWPPEPLIHKAVQWMKIRKMKAHWKYKDYYMLMDFPKEQKILIDLLIAEGKPYLAYREYQFLVSALDGIKETEEYVREMNELMANKEFKEQVKNRQKVTEIESLHINSYKDAFRAYRSYEYEPGVEVKSTAWWKNEVREARKYILKGKTKQDSLMGLRLIDFMWRTAYMAYESVVNTDEDVLTPIYLEIWSLAQSHLPGPEYLLARYYLKEGDTNEAFRHFEEAVDRGFDKWDYFYSDPEMEELRRSRKYKKLYEATLPDTIMEQ